MAGLLAYGPATVALPLVVAVVVALFGRFTGRLTPYLAAIAPAWVLLYGVAGLAEIGRGGVGTPLASGGVEWLAGTGLVVGWAVDGLTSLMLVVVGLVALLVMVFSAGYMHGESGLPRYYGALALFTGAMSLLLIADGFVGLFIGWELVGVCSYLLIGFFFTKPAAAKAAVKAFLTTRVGDVGLLLALALLWREVGDLSYAAVFGAANAMPGEIVTAVCLLLLVGAIGKSAQFPLQIWLPDAMEGPTPVSALIHAATMVAAGVFLVARTWPLFELSPDALAMTLAIGGFTAVAAAGAAAAQRDIKKVLAYSTISQLGFMFAALGAGAWEAAIFHLVTHAAFKALLFLGSGSVIHGSGTQDLYEMGGLLKTMPVTGITWIAGAGALAGVAPLAGFFSKDEVLHAVWGADPAWAAILFVASAMTAFYIARTTRLAFFGAYRGFGHPHEGGLDMRVPLLVLGVGAATLGFAGPQIAEAIGGHHGELDLTVALVSTVLALVGLAGGWISALTGVPPRDGVPYAAVLEWGAAGWKADAAVESSVVRPVLALSRGLDRGVDRAIIDRIAEGTAVLARAAGRRLAALQTGDAQWYAIMSAAGVVALLALVAYVGRGLAG